MQIVVNYVKENKKILLVLLISVIVVSVITILINRNDSSKIYKSESYVYTKETHDHKNNMISELPYINIKGDSINNINVSLIKKYHEIITIDEKIMKYDYYDNDDMISLIIKVYYQESPDSYPDEVLIYNIDKEDGELLNNSSLLNRFNISSDNVIEIITNGIKEYYEYEVNKGYIEKQCDFDCYLSRTESTPVWDDCYYYVRDNELYAYKRISLGSSFFYDIDAGFDLFNFKIK